MSSVATIEPTGTTPYWVEPGRGPGGRSRFLAKIGGLHCSLSALTLGTLAFLIPRSEGLGRAVLGTAGLAAAAALERLPGVKRADVKLETGQARMPSEADERTPEHQRHDTMKGCTAMMQGRRGAAVEGADR